MKLFGLAVALGLLAATAAFGQSPDTARAIAERQAALEETIEREFAAKRGGRRGITPPFWWSLLPQALAEAEQRARALCGPLSRRDALSCIQKVYAECGLCGGLERWIAGAQAQRGAAPEQR